MRFFITSSFLALVSSALAVELCRPQFTTGNKLITLSSDNTKGWNASLSGTTLSGAAIGTPSADNLRTVWKIWSANNGNAVSITSVASGENTCIEGLGGPLGGLACSNVQQGGTSQQVQYFLTCLACDAIGGGTSCKFQSSWEGQCVAVSNFSNTLQLSDCDCAGVNDAQLFNVTPV